MRFVPGPETRAALLKNPIILACGAVVGLLALTAGVLVLVDSARGDSAQEPSVQVDPKTTATTGPVEETAVALGVTGRTRRATAVRERPGNGARVAGTLQRGTIVTIDGRTDEDGWYRIIFPPNSEFHGWLNADDIEVSGDLLTLSVVAPDPPIVVDLPTEFVPADTPTPAPPLGEETPTPEASGTPGGVQLPDLVVGSPPIVSDGQLFVTVINQGPGDFVGDLVVGIFDVDGTSLLGGATLPGFTLPSGNAIDVATGYQVLFDQTLLLIVDPNGAIDEIENANNSVSVAISIGVPPVQDTPTPLPVDTPIPPPAP
jgi:hypothetical protein